VSPVDARPYRGVALSILEGQASAAELLGELATAPPAPWTAEAGDRAAAAPPPRQLDEPAAAPPCSPTRLARAMLAGGAVPVEDPHDAALPRRLAPLAALMPPEVARHPRRGQLRRGGDAGSDEEAARRADPLAALCADAWQAAAPQAPRARAALHLLAELAFAEARPAAAAPDDEAPSSLADALRALEETLGRSEQARARAGDPAELERWLDEARRLAWRRHDAGPPASWARLLHGWGRGWLDGDTADRGAAELPRRFAEQLALRALAAWCAGGEAAPLLAEARWHALLPAAHRRALLGALARCAPSLFADGPGTRPIAVEPTRPPAGSPWRSQKESVDVA
jgi:hypothetical protein